jgi:CheY-like chemotaxis protein
MPNLLWVDDDAPDRFRYEEVVLREDYDWHVTWCQHVDGAASHLTDRTFDAVVLDQMLPLTADSNAVGYWGGYALLHWMRESGGRAPGLPSEHEEILRNRRPHPSNSQTRVCIISAFDDIQVKTAIRAISPKIDIFPKAAEHEEPRALPRVPLRRESRVTEASPVIDLVRVFLAPSGDVSDTATRLVCALRQFFVAHHAYVVITERRSDGDAAVAGAYATTLRGNPASLPEIDCQRRFECIRKSLSWPSRDLDLSHLQWTIGVQNAETPILLGLQGRDSRDAGFAVWGQLHVQPANFDFARTRAEKFERDVDHMSLLLSAIDAVHSRERAENEQQRLEQARERLNNLLIAADPNMSRNLSAINAVLGELAATHELATRSDLREQALRVAKLALNRVQQGQHSCAEPDVSAIGQNLRLLAQKLGGDNTRCGPSDELEYIAHCVVPHSEGVWEPRRDEPKFKALQLLALASRCMQATSSRDPSAVVAQRLQDFSRAVCEHLPSLLHEWAKDGEPRANRVMMRSATAVQTWLRLWFVFDVADLYRAGGIAASLALEPERREMFYAITRTIHECLRTQLYFSSPGFEGQHALTTQALRVLVQHHARWRSRVPHEVELAAHLEDIDANRQGQIDAEGHLEHVLDVYIGGYFLANLHIGTSGSEPSKCNRAAIHVAGQVELGPSPKAMTDYLTAYALAALFHDSGMMLFPILPPVDRGLTSSDDSVSRALARVRNTVTDAGRTLVDMCLRELEIQGCLDQTQTPEFAAWVDRQRENGEPDHALLSGWYLLTSCTRAGSLRPEVIRAAVRATVLHGALGVSIDSCENPVAAMLVVCDEIFDWRPARRQRPDVELRSALAANVIHGRGRPSRGRARHFGIAGIWAHSDQPGKLVVGLDPGERAANGNGGAQPSWPNIVIGLRSQNDLDASVIEHWLRSAQNIGRIRHSGAGWGPSVTLESEVPPRLMKLGKTTRTLLNETVQRTRLSIRGRLQHWLETALFSDFDSNQVRIEAVQLIALNRPLANDDIAAHLPELVAAASEVLFELERA